MGQVNEKCQKVHSNSRIESIISFSYSRDVLFSKEVFFDSRDFIDSDYVKNSYFIGISPINYDNSADINEMEENASIDQQNNLINEMENRNNNLASIETSFISQETTSQNKSNKKKRHLGRKTKEEKANHPEGSFHDMYREDNVSTKIQRHFLNFIIALLNNIFPLFNYNKKLFKLDNDFKKNIKKDKVESLKDKTIGDIISYKISEKYRTINDKAEANKKIYEEIKDIPVLNKILSENYLVFFKKFYYNSYSYINLKDYDLDENIIFTKDVKNFKHLLKENEKRGSQYIRSIKRHVLKNYFSGSIFMC